MQRAVQTASTSSTTTPPTSKTVAFDVKPVMQRYSSSSSISKTSQIALKASETIQSKSRCATFFYNVPRSSIMLTLPGFVFLITGACLVATKDPHKDWFDDGVLVVAFVFLVVGGVWSVVAVVFWTALWFRNKPKLLPKNLNKLPQYNQMNSPSIPLSSPNINTNNNNSNFLSNTRSFEQQRRTTQSTDSSVFSPVSDFTSPSHSDVFFGSHSPQPNQNLTHKIEKPVTIEHNVNRENTEDVSIENNKQLTLSVENNEGTATMKKNTPKHTEEKSDMLPVTGSAEEQQQQFTQEQREAINKTSEIIVHNNLSDTAIITQLSNLSQPVSNTEVEYRNNVEVF